ncbi:MAG: orotidine-5'-phosphate decarboxylase [Oscillospiraceae bacterium]|nr:orotidine-5'-phosphate decarboxylase [Oscillospiraceae bacterium]
MSIDVLQSKIRKTRCPIVVGLDPTPELIPPAVLEAANAERGQGLDGLALAYERFCCGVLDALKGVVPAIKVNSACFLALGHAGAAAMEAVLAYARRLKFYVLLETMRSDVEHVAALTARSVFGGLTFGEETVYPYPCDGLVVGGYLGSDGIRPYLPYLTGENAKSLFVVVRSSNRSSGEVQELISGDRDVQTAMADLTLRWNGENLFGKFGFGAVGAVVGAQSLWTMQNLRRRYDTLFFLVPGYGPQGAFGKYMAAAFDRLGRGAAVTASRAILGAWKQEGADPDYGRAALDAVEKLRALMETYVTVM